MIGCAWAVWKNGASAMKRNFARKKYPNRTPTTKREEDEATNGYSRPFLLLRERRRDELHDLIGEDGAVEDGREDHRGYEIDLEGLVEVDSDERPPSGKEVELHPREEEGDERHVCPGEGYRLGRLSRREEEYPQEPCEAEERHLHPVLELVEMFADVERIRAQRRTTSSRGIRPHPGSPSGSSTPGWP